MEFYSIISIPFLKTSGYSGGLQRCVGWGLSTSSPSFGYGLSSYTSKFKIKLQAYFRFFVIHRSNLSERVPVADTRQSPPPWAEFVRYFNILILGWAEKLKTGDLIFRNLPPSLWVTSGSATDVYNLTIILYELSE